MPSGVQLSSPIVPPGRQTRTSSSAAAWWWGANIAPIDDMTTSNDSSSKGRFSASASTHSSSTPVGLGARAAGLEQLGRQVAGGDVARRSAAAGIEALPVPAATSRTRMPGPIPHASTSRGPSGSRNVSTIDG